MKDELSEQKELNKKLFNTLLSLQDKYIEVCKELHKKNTSLSTNIQENKF